jgi:hypothetical protein
MFSKRVKMAATSQFSNLDIELEEEIFESRPDDNRFDQVVGELEDILMDQEFNEFQQTYMSNHSVKFQPGPENKLEYMEIFQNYV